MNGGFLRDTDDQLEKLGIQTSERYLSAADLVLACADDANTLDGVREAIGRHTAVSVLAVRTKADLVADKHKTERAGISWVSARTGAGLSSLTGAIDHAIDVLLGPGVDGLHLDDGEHGRPRIIRRREAA